ncbi:hypothetical protein QBC37DRAFT_86806 [Rhypophila decipiens]|uniref:Zn(2)-C6 fungal-type domain-containing protein n=1 Tax=Rhypophila decipiens TaxID=261697 RepID=A0AAN6YDC6_9PEZI|nr:hypothetical protein QBC37DRAFT_86806 [Rhypophila decipiens]
MSGFTRPLPSPLSSTSSSSAAPTPAYTPAAGSQVPGQSMRRLLPATATSAEMNAASLARNPSPGSATSAARSESPQPSASRKRRQTTTAACGPCRKRKSRCDGRRPSCSACVGRDTNCEYETKVTETHTQALKRKFNELQDRQSVHEEVFNILKGRPEKDALEVLKRIRQGVDPTTIVRHVTCGNVLLQLSLVPEARYRYEFPYKTEMPVFLTRRDNPYLESEMYEYALRTPAEPKQLKFIPTPAREESQSQSPGPDTDADRHLAPYWRPYHAAEIIDPNFDEVRPSRWTQVCTDDGLMRKLMQSYLLYECSWLAPFHKDYFLRDMADERHRFCSAFLVNAVLASGCVYYKDVEYRGEHWNPKFIGYQFLAEARRLFDIESEVERPHILPSDPLGPQKLKEWECHQLTTIQACVLLNLTYNCNGSDAIGWRYTARALDMAREIGLFDGADEYGDRHTQCVRTYTAWAVYLYQGTHRYHCFRAPVIKDPPQSRLPDPNQYPEWYGELWVRYPYGLPRTPTHHALVWKARADLLTICIEYANLAFKESASALVAELPVSQILKFYDRLIRWREELPDPLTPKKIVMPNHLKLHMYYNLILVNILRPVVHDRVDGGDLSPFHWPLLPSHRSSPRDAYLDAKIHFDTALRLYYLRHGFEVPDSFIGQFLSSLTRLTVDAINEDPTSPFVEDWRSTVLLTAKGVYEQSKSVYVMRALLQIQIGLMTPRDVERLKHFARIEKAQEIHAPLEEPIHSNWPTYIVGHEHGAENLTRQLGNLSLGPATSSSSGSRKGRAGSY